VVVDAGGCSKQCAPSPKAFRVGECRRGNFEGYRSLGQTPQEQVLHGGCIQGRLLRSLSSANFCDEETRRRFVFGAMQASEGRVFGSSKQGMGFKGRAFGKDHMEMTGHALGSNVGDFGVDSNGFGPNVQVSGRLVVDRNQVVGDQGEQLGKDSRVLGTGALCKGGITMEAMLYRHGHTFL